MNCVPCCERVYVGMLLAGPIFLYSAGHIQFLSISDVEMVKELSTCTSLSLGKPSYLVKERGALLGQGILSSSGSTWAYQRKIIAPELYLHKVKVILPVHCSFFGSLQRNLGSSEMVDVHTFAYYICNCNSK